MRRLRDPVSRDRAQDFNTIIAHTIDYELADAIEHDDMQHIPEELVMCFFRWCSMPS